MRKDELKARVLALVSQPNLVMVLSTVDEEGRPQSRFMGAMVPVSGAEFAWYFETMRQARKVKQLARCPFAQVLVSRADYSEVATFSGRAALVEEPEVKKAVWEAVPASGGYFTGWDAPEFAVLRFNAEKIEYLNLTLQLEPFSLEV